MWLSLERIPEKDEQIELALGDHRANLLVATQRPAVQLMDAHTQLLLQ
jgi:hypothetical protein